MCWSGGIHVYGFISQKKVKFYVPTSFSRHQLAWSTYTYISLKSIYFSSFYLYFLRRPTTFSWPLQWCGVKRCSTAVFHRNQMLLLLLLFVYCCRSIDNIQMPRIQYIIRSCFSTCNWLYSCSQLRFHVCVLCYRLAHTWLCNYRDRKMIIHMFNVILLHRITYCNSSSSVG